ncbi:MAG: hypothetical protein Q9162_000924 [Coniocarpon cinnabarinum]
MDSQSRERRYIANPNFLGPSSTPSSSSGNLLGPSTQQSNPQIGPPDPFHRSGRDPLRPSSHADNRDNGLHQPPYWQSSSSAAPQRQQDFQHRDILQPGPPPPQSPFSRHPPFGREQPRRASVGGETSSDPRSDPTGSTPMFYNRHMPPPASSPQHSPPHSLAYPISRGPLRSPPHHSASRDASSGPTMYRSANMSISSLVGADSPAATRPPAWSPPSTSHGRPPSHHSHLPLSPQKPPTYGPITNDARSPTSQPQYGPFNTPHPNGTTFKNHDGSAESTKHLSSPGFAGYYDSARLPRPPSQQESESHSRPRRDTAHKSDLDSINGRERPADLQQHNVIERSYHLSRATNPRERAFSDLSRPSYGPYETPVQSAMPAPMNRPRSPLRREDRDDGPLQYGRWSPRHATDIRDADRPIASREGPQLPPDQLEGPIYGPFLPHQDPRQYGTNMPIYGPHPRSGPPLVDRNDYPDSIINIGNEKSTRPMLDERLRRSLEDSQMAHRSVLGANQEARRRIERSSPLPQAVQGASGQPVGSGRDPTIKSEFGRMFSGLGSGVGSTPVPMPPASNSSPTPNRGIHSIDSDRRASLMDGFPERQSRSPGAERLKRAFEADGRLDPVDGVEGRMTPSFGRNKRSKHAHTTPHHHHHSLGHHHHHRLPKADEDTSAPLLGRRIGGTPLSTIKFSNNLSNGPATPGIVRGHHHHIPPHHHHHHRNAAPATPTTPLPTLRQASTIIRTSPLVDSVAHIPRKHLGSNLYAPQIGPPPASTASFSKFQFASKPEPLPVLEGKDNCTFTIRVPRELLSDKSREQTMSERQIWGTDVYTDDSDVLAAAIHSGWILGAWADDVDLADLQLSDQQQAQDPVNGDGLDDKSEKKDPCATISKPPALPSPPPPNRDAHITILILPPLENYSACTWHGMRSRAWGDNHDASTSVVSSPLTSSQIDTLLANPTWSVNDLLPQSDSTPSAETSITPSKLHHLLRISALPPPSSPAEEKKMLEQLQQQLHFVRQIQSVDVEGVEPMVRVRDETNQADGERTLDLEAMREELEKERWVGRWVRRLKKPEVPKEKRESEDWDVLGQAPRRVGGYFVVEGGSSSSE